MSTTAMPPSAAPAARLVLVVVEGEDAGKSVAIDARKLVGTSEHCHLVLADRTVSRRHLVIEPSALGARVRDEGSKNGVWLGDARVLDVELAPGSELRAGTTRLRLEVESLAPARASEAPVRGSFGRFIGSARVLASMYGVLERAARTDATVLLEGESGAGKELLAEALHDESPRASGPFVVVDCGSVPETLIESELFGHERGAFTGAERARAGAFEQAQGGSIFLDEIGELPLAMQTRLLRVLDRKRVKRLGSEKQIDLDVRVVAATNRNLEREVEQGTFRLDLFHRLAVVLVRVPPLREREGDIELLAKHFARAMTGDEARLDEASLERMRRHDWPGNVRELRNHVERLILLGDAPMTSARAPSGDGALIGIAKSGLPWRQVRAEALEELHRLYTDDMLARHDGNVSRAAKAAGVARRHFQRLKSDE
ncbi:MAG: sigma 54-interacting transcriptional regulator [Sandaracinaceae bacterium]|nr:sigma 54-interacting transcriptional regulator [Sandaracinaceae bacterium]